MAGKPERKQRDQLKGHRLQWSRWATMGLRVKSHGEDRKIQKRFGGSATDEDLGLDIEERKESRTPARFGESEKGR